MLTTQSPLGKLLKGKREEDEVTLTIDEKSKIYDIVTVR
ncbi:hypothetical protein JCM19238_2887 [Vibrio ponticus]|nr:hypothetical protein JCM19238_2887 [Vibrio ponticus]